jgi:ABC-2 type transport system permease protein
MFVSVCTLALGTLLFHVHLPLRALPGLALAIAVTSFACVGLGLLNAALGLRWRETAILSNLLLFVLLMFAGVNVPLDRLPGWMSTLAQGLPVTHGAKAARALAGGEAFTGAFGLIAAEALVGTLYVVVGLVAIRVFEREAQRGATLEVA